MNRRLPTVSLLDAGALPVAQLARIAMKESVRPRAAYQAHKWFARRLAITARALLVSAAATRGDEFWRCYYRGDSWIGRSVLDPFVGGGVMLLEASRLGADVYGVDIEPVAAAIAKFQTSIRKLPKLHQTLDRLRLSVGEALAPFYEARDCDGRRETLLHAFWVQRVRCKGCGHRFDAHPTFRFAWDEARDRQWVACKSCSGVIEAYFAQDRVTCTCGGRTDVIAGHLNRGEAQCPACGHHEPLIDMARRLGRPEFRIFAVETLPKGDARRHATACRRIRTATPFDKGRYRAAQRRLGELVRDHPNILPRGNIPKRGRSDTRLLDYGYTDYRQLFNARQQLHLALVGREIARLKGPAGEAMAMAFSDHLTTNNMMCGYAGGWRRLTPIFSIRAYRHIARPVELNPWLRRNGRGTFPNAVRSIERAVESLRQPVEPTPKGLLKSVDDAKPGRTVIGCGNACDLKRIKSDSIDLVLTDPPYFDYISYSELGHFFAPWLARFQLITSKQARGFPLGQLASRARTVDAEMTFAKSLKDAFAEIARVSRPEGRVVFTYQNLDGRGWHAVAQALAHVGIVPFTMFPLYGDSSASLHKHAQSISWDCVMVCHLGEALPAFSISPAARAEGSRVALRWVEKLGAQDLLLTDGDRTNLAHAAAILAEFSLRKAKIKFKPRTMASA